MLREKETFHSNPPALTNAEQAKLRRIYLIRGLESTPQVASGLGPQMVEETYWNPENHTLTQEDMMRLSEIFPPKPDMYISLWIDTGLWWFMLVVSVLSVLMDVVVLLKLQLGGLRKQSQTPILRTIILSQGVMLSIIVLVMIFHEPILRKMGSGKEICKAHAFALNYFGFLTNWSWFLLWAQRYVAVFHPLQTLTNSSRVGPAIGVVMIAALLIEGWTIPAVTELTLGEHNYCGMDQSSKLMGEKTLRWLTEIGRAHV